MHAKRREQEYQFTIWISTSIILHLLLILVAFFWYLHISINHHVTKQDQQSKTEQYTLLTQNLLQNQKKEHLIYTLIPGRKAITEQLQKQDEVKNAQEQPKEEIKQHTENLEQPLPRKKHFIIPKPQIQRHEAIKQQFLQQKNDHILDDSAEPTKILKNQIVPTITKKHISLQDLKLGFSKFLNEGNNDILLQHGNTNQAPDTQSLRLITYNQQVAKTMQESILTHQKFDTLKQIHGKRIFLTLTIERNGKLIHATIIHPSGYPLLDKIVEESLNQIKLYPQVPEYIPEEPYTMKWTLLF